MTELTNKQIVKLAGVIEDWILKNSDLRWQVAVEQAEGWSEEQYYEMFPEEEA